MRVISIIDAEDLEQNEEFKVDQTFNPTLIDYANNGANEYKGGMGACIIRYLDKSGEDEIIVVWGKVDDLRSKYLS